MARLRAALLVLLILPPCAGCFVFDELDKGQEIMEQLGPGKAKKKKEEAATAAPASPSTARRGPGAMDRLKGWWRQATEPAPAPPDPNDKIVSCTLGGSTQFMRKSDCELRGGRGAVLEDEAADGA
jgi:hypothetical protein